jgi:hypothetical protein
MIAATRVTWLARRLSRISPAEVPYRVAHVLRGVWQSRGIGDARRVPAQLADARFGKPWIALAPVGVDHASVITRADALVSGHLEVFGVPVPFIDGAPDWNRDPVSGRSIDLRFGLFIDFRHIPGLDIKHLWEVNRHCWWVPVAQAWALTRDARYLQTLLGWLRSWLADCPYPMGANWSSPVEHGIRLINWSLVWHLVGGADSPMFAGPDGVRLRNDWVDAVFRHMRFAADNYSKHSSADNHLIGEAAGVVLAAQTWDYWQEGRRLGAQAQRILEDEALRQFAPDGVNWEQALCYQKFSLQFLLSAGLALRANGEDLAAATWQRIEASLRCLASMTDVNGNVPAIGDADDASVFELVHGDSVCPWQSLLAVGAALFPEPNLKQKVDSVPPGCGSDLVRWLKLDEAARASMSARPLTRRFDHGGYLVAGKALDTANEVRLTMDVGPLGINRVGGHAHADALSLLLSWGGAPFLIDPGTYCYNGSPAMRRYFRGTSAHNTLEVDGTEQSIYGSSFLWLRDYESVIEVFEDDDAKLVIQARHDGYSRLKPAALHSRKVEFDKSAMTVRVTDTLVGSGSHEVALHWHLDAECVVNGVTGGCVATVDGRSLSLRIEGAPTALVRGQESPPLGWQSRRFYQKQPAWVLRAAVRLEPGQALITTMKLRAVGDRRQ